MLPDKVLTELAKEEMDEENKAYAALDPSVLAFLESHSYEDRLNILSSMHDRITDDMINTMAVAMDLGDRTGRSGAALHGTEELSFNERKV